jgi:hypothetical protein
MTGSGVSAAARTMHQLKDGGLRFANPPYNGKNVIGKARTDGELASLRISGFRHLPASAADASNRNLRDLAHKDRRRLLIGRPLCYKDHSSGSVT